MRQATALDAAAAMRLRGAFAVDPYRACVGLATAAARRGARFFERSAVKQVRPDARKIDVTLATGTVTAETAIITTGTATAEFKPLRRHFKRSRKLSRADGRKCRRRSAGSSVAGDSTLRDTRSPRHRIRWTADERILIAGA